MTSHCIVFVTASSSQEAKRLAETLVKEKWAACVNVVPGVRSHYWWKGKREWASEQLLIIKTRRARVLALVQRVKALHSYSVPEVLAVPVIAGNLDYLRWIDESLSTQLKRR